MRFKRNFVTIAYSAVFILLMLISVFYIVSMSYDTFDVSGMGILYAVLMAIGVGLILIACFFLHEKGTLKGIQATKAPLVVIEVILVVGAVGLGFYLNQSNGIENGIWIGFYLACVYGVCRVLGGRLCGIFGLGISLALTYFAFDTGWAVFDKEEMLDILCILVPFFTFLIIMKYMIPLFGKESFIVVCALVVQSAIFGAAIAMNPLAIVLLVGCVLSLIFAKLRTADTIVTKGPFMAVFLLVLSAGAAFGVSLLLEKDFMDIITINLDQGFRDALNSGELLKYSLDKFRDMLSLVMYHAFDYGIFSSILLLFAAFAGFFAIKRKLSEIGPLILTMLVALVGYVMVGVFGGHGYYMTYLIGVFAAYGMYNALLPEFLHLESDEDAYDFDEVNDAGSNRSEVKEKVAVENHESSASDSSDVSQAAQTVNGAGDRGRGSNSINQVTAGESDEAHFQEWHVSAEFVREDELRKERQEERERSYRVAKEQAEAKAAGKSEEDIAAIATAAEDEVKAAAPGRVVYTGEDSHPTETTVQASVPPINANSGGQDLVLDFSDVIQEDNSDGVATAPVATPPASVQSGIDYGPDMSQIPNKNPSDKEDDQEIHSSFQSDSDTIVLSGYQNEKKMHGAADLLNAINEAQIPTVEIPDVPSVNPAVSEPVSEPASEDGTDISFYDDDVKEAADADIKLAEAAANFSVNDANNMIQPGEDEQLDNLLDRLDMSDSIKRMNESAREDMADVIEQADDPAEEEVVLVNEDYNFGSDDGEYGEVPTVSDLEDRWRAEQELQKVPEEEVPDVVSADEVSVDDVMSGFDFTSNDAPEETAFDEIGSSVPDSMDDMVSSDLAEDDTNVLMMDAVEEPSDDRITMDLSDEQADDMVSSFRPEEPVDESEFMTMPEEVAPAVDVQTEEFTPVTDMQQTEEFTPVTDMQQTEEFTPVTDMQQIEEFTSVTDMQPEEVMPATEAPKDDRSEFVSFMDMAGRNSGITQPEEITPTAEQVSDSLRITPFEPERIEMPETEAVKPEPEMQLESEPQFTHEPNAVKPELEMQLESEPQFTHEPDDVKPEPEPVVNHTEQSPVYSFTSKDVNIDIREDEGQLGIPKPGDESMSSYVDRYAAASSRNGRPMAADLDNYEKKKTDRPIHTEEVVSHSGNGSRSYHKIILK